MAGYKQTARWSVTMMILTAGNAAVAQTTPPVTMRGATTTPVTAAEAAHQMSIIQAQVQDGLSYKSATYPMDSMQRVITKAGERWMAQLAAGSVKGMQLDPSGRVGIAAGQEPYARQQIAARLATPGLALHDRAHTYMVAVQAFSDWYYPERLADAERYITQLDALGDSVAYWRFQARRDLIWTYYLLGRTDDVIRHGEQAVAVVPLMSFWDRGLMFPLSVHGGTSMVYTAIAEALSGRPGGAQKIAAINEQLKRAIVTPPTLVALDSAFVARGRSYQEALSGLISANSRLGTQGAPIFANYWVNRPTTDSALFPVNDGKIRVLALTSYG